MRIPERRSSRGSQPKVMAGDLKQREARGPFLFGAGGAVIAITTLPLFLNQLQEGAIGSLTMLLTLTSIPAALLGLTSAALLWVASMDLPRSKPSPRWDACALIMVTLNQLAVAAGMVWFVNHALRIGAIPGRRTSILISRSDSPIAFYIAIALFGLCAAATLWHSLKTMMRVLR